MTIIVEARASSLSQGCSKPVQETCGGASSHRMELCGGPGRNVWVLYIQGCVPRCAFPWNFASLGQVCVSERYTFLPLCPLLDLHPCPSIPTSVKVCGCLSLRPYLRVF